MWGNLPPDRGTIRPLAGVYDSLAVSTALKAEGHRKTPGGLLLFRVTEPLLTAILELVTGLIAS
jgi:hypothetical protein